MNSPTSLSVAFSTPASAVAAEFFSESEPGSSSSSSSSSSFGHDTNSNSSANANANFNLSQETRYDYYSLHPNSTSHQPEEGDAENESEFDSDFENDLELRDNEKHSPQYYMSTTTSCCHPSLSTKYITRHFKPGASQRMQTVASHQPHYECATPVSDFENDDYQVSFSRTIDSVLSVTAASSIVSSNILPLSAYSADVDNSTRSSNGSIQSATSPRLPRS